MEEPAAHGGAGDKVPKGRVRWASGEKEKRGIYG
jgi:hypothetical protein